MLGQGALHPAVARQFAEDTVIAGALRGGRPVVSADQAVSSPACIEHAGIGASDAARRQAWF